MKFLLVGHGGSYNRGCEAIVRSTIDLLREEFGTVKILLSSFDYKNEQRIFFGDDVKVIDANSRMWKKFSKDWFLRQFWRVFKKSNILEIEYSPILKQLKDVDAVLSVGGDNYTVDYEYSEYFLKLNNLIKLFGKKLIIWGASIGPFKEDENIMLIIDNLKKVDLITVREMETIEYLKSLGISENVRLVADTAFLLPSDTSGIDNIFCDISSEKIGFNISPILSSYAKNKSKDEIIHESIIFLKNIINTYKMHILLIPHVTSSKPENNDYYFMKHISDAIIDTGMISLLPPVYNAMQMKAIISKCRFYIGARTHSTIAALSTGVPTLSIGYSVKSKGINKDIFGNYDFLVDINDLSAESLLKKYEQMTKNELEIRRLLSEKIPLMKALARENITYLKQII